MTGPQSPRSRCFTLIELLAVLVILSSVAALTVNALGRLPHVHQERAAVDAVMRAWERTSLLARRSNGAILTSEGATLIAQANTIDEHRLDDPEIREHLPRGWQAQLDEDQKIRFNVQGRSRDIQCVITGPHDTLVRFVILGISGQRVDPGDLR